MSAKQLTSDSCATYRKKNRMSSSKLTRGYKNELLRTFTSSKKAKELKSDNELAHFLGITRQSINGIKKGGGFSDEIAIKVAEITKRPLADILIMREVATEQNERIRAAWLDISKKAGIAASIALALRRGAVFIIRDGIRLV